MWRRAFFIFWLKVLAILLPVLLSDCINVTAKKSQGVHVHASMRNQTAVVMLLFFVKYQKLNKALDKIPELLSTLMCIYV